MQQVNTEYGPLLPKYVEFREHATAGFMLAGLLIASRHLHVRSNLITLPHQNTLAWVGES